MSQTSPVPAVECIGIYKTFDTASVVRGLDFSVSRGQILALLGPSGCGKTTTLRLIAGFERPDAGRIVIAGQTVADERGIVPPEKRRIGVVFQDYAIFPHLNVSDNVGFGVERGIGKRERIVDMLDFAGLEDHGKKMPDQLSGGQQQRVALARALAPHPQVLLLDEPFSNLDAGLRSGMRQEVRRLLKNSSTTAIFVTHDQEEAMTVGDVIAVMYDGVLQQVGTPEQIFHEPETRFVAEFMGQTDFVRAEVSEQGLLTPLGLLPQRLPLPAGTNVEVAVRADDVSIMADNSDHADAGVLGRIVSREFVGIAYIYRVAMPDGTQVNSWVDHTTDIAEDTPVRVRITDRHLLNCYLNGRRVPNLYA